MGLQMYNITNYLENAITDQRLIFLPTVTLVII
jgi:hypothetical protein